MRPGARCDRQAFLGEMGCRQNYYMPAILDTAGQFSINLTFGLSASQPSGIILHP